MSNNSSENDRDVVLGLLRFVGTGLTVISAIIAIGTTISRARSLEPDIVYTIPLPPVLSLSGPTPAPAPALTLTHTSPISQSNITPTNINYYYYDGKTISTEPHSSTDQLIITADFANTGPIPETAELPLLISGKIAESKTTMLIPGGTARIFTVIQPGEMQYNPNPSAIVLTIPTSPGRRSHAN